MCGLTLCSGSALHQKTGDTPLFNACRSGSLPLVSLLLARLGPEASKAVVGTNFAGRTPLHCAAFSGCAPMVELLLQHGGDVHVADEVRLISQFHRKGPGKAHSYFGGAPQKGLTALHVAARAGRIYVMRVLLAAGAAVGTAHPPRMETPLHAAASAGEAAAVRFLLDHGADPDARDAGEPGRTAAEVATSDAVKAELSKRASRARAPGGAGA